VNRYKAKGLGAEWYDAKQPCEKGHLSLRRTRDCKCWDCLKWAEAVRATATASRSPAKKRPPTEEEKRRERAASFQVISGR
jgi:hypothetical protein